MAWLTKKTDYGLELMMTLARNYQQGPVSLESIASQKRLPYKFLEQAASILKQAGLVESKEGRGGGYFLKAAPKKINLRMIVKALEGSFATKECQGCFRKTVCGPKSLHKEAEDSFYKTIAQKTVYDLI